MRASACAFATLAIVALASAPAWGDGTPVSAFRKRPWLQSVEPTGASVRFELPQASRAEVALRGPDGATRTFASGAPVELHAVRLTGLAPSTSYRYEVHAGEATALGAFTTAPADARPFSFILFGDSRSDATTHAAVVRAIEGTPSDFLLNTGDLVERGDDPRQWDELFDLEHRLLASRCMWSVVGNHELIGDRRGPAFARYFATGAASGEPRLYDTVRWGDTRFFLLDAMDDWTGPERDWLLARLAESDGEPGLRHRIVAAHIGPYSSGPHGGNRAMHAAGIVDALRAHHVDLVVAGHDHAYERGEAEGLKYLVSGGAGAPLYPVARRLPTSAVVESTYHFVEVKIDGPTIATVVHRLDGSVLESCSFEPGEPWRCGVGAGPSASEPSAPVRAVPTARGQRCSCEAAGASADGGWGPALAAACLALLRRRRRG